MSKNSQRRREATEKAIANIPNKEPSHYEKKLMEEEMKKDNARPSLIKRIGVALLDFVFTIAFAGVLFTGAYFTIFEKVGYNEASDIVLKAYSESHLYLNDNGNFKLISEYYDTTKTPEENYDVPITSFYSENERAIKDGKLETYNNLKISTGYYELDGNGNYVRTEGTTADVAKTFLEQEYNKAVDYLFEDETIINASRLSYNTIIFTLLIVLTISSIAFYIVVPLIDKKHRTFGYMIGKVMPVDSKELKPVFWEKILFRSLIFIVFTFISPVTLFYWAGKITFSFIPFFVNTAILCFSHSNSGIHDYAVRVNIINESYSNPFANLKAITEQGGDQ